MLTKICNTCKRELPATSQYFYKMTASRDGLRSSCKECQGGRFFQKEIIPEGFRRCNRCGELLPENEENFLRYFHTARKKYYFKCHCRACGASGSKDWRKKNRKRATDYSKAYQKSDAGKATKKRYNERHAEEIRKYRQAYRIKNADRIKIYDRNRRLDPSTREKILSFATRWRANNASHVSSYNRKYVAEHPDYFVRAAELRRSREMQLDSTLSPEEWQKTLDYFDGKCAYCRKPSEIMQQDHFIPLSKGGPYVFGNMVPACKSCNCRKHDSEFESWYRKQAFYNAEQEEKIKYFVEHANPEVTG